MQEKNKEKSFKETLFIVGPTAVGKTDFSYQLSALSKTAVINCDVGQFYTALSIGTAKPDVLNSPFEHHLFNILDLSEDFNIGRYREKCEQLVLACEKSSTTPLIVGGSLFYAEALFFKHPSRSVIAHMEPTKKEVYSWDLLNRIDSARALKIHPHDSYRIGRALDVWYTTGTLPSDYTLSFDPISKKSHLFFLTREREDLYERINKRTDFMLQSGWIEEVESLSAESKYWIKEKRIIGYAEIADYIESRSTDIKRLTEIIAQKTRNYAKRQLTYWTKLKSNLLRSHGVTIHEINLTLSRIDLYIELVASLNQNINNE